MKGSRNVALTLDVHGTPAENLQVCCLLLETWLELIFSVLSRIAVLALIR
jgi:hypothetical protein